MFFLSRKLSSLSAHPLQVPSAMTLTDREALVALYHATGGADWVHRENWNTGSDLSEWYGVETTNGGVVKICLDDNDLLGILSPHLCRYA